MTFYGGAEARQLEARVRRLEEVVEKLLSLQVDQANEARVVLEELWGRVEVGGPQFCPDSNDGLCDL